MRNPILAFIFTLSLLAAKDIQLQSVTSLTPGQQTSMGVTLTQPAPSGGVFISLASSDPTTVTITPANILIPQGATSVSRAPQISSLRLGSAVITATAYGMIGDAQTIVVSSTGTIVLPSSYSVTVSQSAAFPVALSVAAPVGGVQVSLTSSDPTTASISPSTVTIGAGSTAPAVQPQVSGLKAGLVTITASASGYNTASQSIQVQPAQASAALSFSPSALTIAQGASGSLVLNLSAPAPAGGLTVSLTSSNAGVLNAPSNVVFAANATSVPVSVTGIAAGTATLSAVAASNTISGSSATVTVTPARDINLPKGLAVAPGQQLDLAITLANPAPSGGVFISLATSDATKLTVSPSNILITQGSTSTLRPPQLSGISAGSATLSATAYGLTGDSQVVIVGTAQSLSPATLAIQGSGVTQSLTLTLSSAASAGGVTFSLSSSNPAVATVPASVLVAAGSVSVQVPVTSVGAGTAVIRSSGLPAYADSTATVTVTVPTSGGGAIALPAGVTLSPGQIQTFAVTLSSAAPAGGVVVTLASSDSSKVTITPTSVTIPAGATAPFVQPQVMGAGLGSALITASAPGYSPASQTVQTSGALAFTPGSLSFTAPGAQNLTLTLSAAVGSVLSVALTSTNPGVASVPANVTLAAGSVAVTVPVTALTSGSTSIVASAAGVSSATAGVTVAGTTTTGTIALPAGVQASPNQPVPFPVTLSVPAPAGGVNVTLSSSSASITVTASVYVAAGATTPATQPQVTASAYGPAVISASAPGYTGTAQTVQCGAALSFSPASLTLSGATGSVTLNLSSPAPSGGLTVNLAASNPAVVSVPANVTFAANASSVTVPVTGMSSGSATITATATVSTVTGASVSVTTNPGKAISLPSGVVIAPTQQASFPVTLAQPAPSGGVFITLTSSDPSKVTIAPSNVLVTQGMTTLTQQPLITGIGIGTASITASAYNMVGDTQTVLVNSPSSSFSFSPTSISLAGVGTSQTIAINIPAVAPAGGLTVTLSSSNTAVATLPSVVVIPAGYTTATFTVSGLGSGTATLTATASGYGSTTARVTVTASPSILFPATLATVVSQPVTLAVTLSQPAPSSGVTITFTSSNYNIAAVSPLTIVIPAGATAPETQPMLYGYAVGSATIGASAPGYISASQTATVTANSASAVWHGACWYHGTIYGVVGDFQAVDFILTTPTPATVQGTLYYAADCDPRNGVDNLNDYDSTTSSTHTIQGFTYHPNIVPSSAIYWVGPRTVDGKCAPGSPCSGCLNYTATTPSCSSMP